MSEPPARVAHPAGGSLKARPLRPGGLETRSSTEQDHVTTLMPRGPRPGPIGSSRQDEHAGDVQAIRSEVPGGSGLGTVGGAGLAVATDGEAVEAAGCEIVDAPNEGAGHEEKDFQPSDYKQNPPTSGNHFPQWYEDGIYESGSAPDLGMQVHTLEHGRINVQYRPGAPDSTIAELEALLAEQSDGYHMLLYENVTDMPYAVAATAWGRSVGCKTMNDKVFDVLRTFRTEYIDQGPEDVP